MESQFYATTNKRTFYSCLFITNKIYVNCISRSVLIVSNRNQCHHWRSPFPAFAAILRHLWVCPSVYGILNFSIAIWTKAKNLIYTHQMAKRRCRSLNRIPPQAIQWKWARQARWDSIGNCPFLLDVTPLSFIFSIDFWASIGTRLYVCSCLLFAEIINLFCKGIS